MRKMNVVLFIVLFFTLTSSENILHQINETFIAVLTDFYNVVTDMVINYHI